jgi:hypothetical protein
MPLVAQNLIYHLEPLFPNPVLMGFDPDEAEHRFN